MTTRARTNAPKKHAHINNKIMIWFPIDKAFTYPLAVFARKLGQCAKLILFLLQRTLFLLQARQARLESL